MPNWTEVLNEINETKATQAGNPFDIVRKKYLEQMHQHTKRNVIAYYSGWLQKRNGEMGINDRDKNALMMTINKLNRNLGLDLILHTPGGDLAATESMVDYLYAMFGSDIRAIIPQISMSAGTMIALSCKSIMMGKQSNLGPIDPQMGGLPCQAVISEFEKAKDDIRKNPASAELWRQIISKYHPTFLGACQHAINWSDSLAENWITRNMCGGDGEKAKKILKEFSDHDTNKSHARHLSKLKCEEIGLTIEAMEDDQRLQDLILTIHHAYMHTFSHTSSIKIVENHIGGAYSEEARPQQAMPVFNMTQQPMNIQ